NERDFRNAGLDWTFVQEGHSGSSRGVLRGLHYQDMTAPMGKLLRCTSGEIFDVVVDLRVASPTFGQHLAVVLTAARGRQIYVPPGFAHGFQALTEHVEVQYRQTGFYTPQSEGTLLWNAPELGIEWPILEPVLSTRDRQGITLTQYLERPAFRVSEQRPPSSGRGKDSSHDLSHRR